MSACWLFFVLKWMQNVIWRYGFCSNLVLRSRWWWIVRGNWCCMIHLHTQRRTFKLMGLRERSKLFSTRRVLLRSRDGLICEVFFFWIGMLHHCENFIHVSIKSYDIWWHWFSYANVSIYAEFRLVKWHMDSTLSTKFESVFHKFGFCREELRDYYD